MTINQTHKPKPAS